MINILRSENEQLNNKIINIQQDQNKVKMAQLDEKNEVIQNLRQEALELKFKINEINHKYKAK